MKQPLLKLEQVEICYAELPWCTLNLRSGARGDSWDCRGVRERKSTVIKGIIGLLGNEGAVTEGKSTITKGRSFCMGHRRNLGIFAALRWDGIPECGSISLSDP